MRSSIHMLVHTTASVGVACLLMVGAAAAQTTAAKTKQTAPPTTIPADVLAAQQFLFSAYPELAERPLTIHLKPVEGQVLVSVEDARTNPDDTTPGVPLIIAALAFDAHGQLQRYAGRGALLEQTRNDLLGAQLRAHPDWGESDLDAWLTAAGGATTVTGAAPETATTLATEPWRGLLGTDVTATTTAFQWRPSKTNAAATKGSTNAPAWIVNATAIAADGSTVQYRLEYEPFGGRLVAVTRQ